MIMETYDIILNDRLLRDFIAWLPDTLEDEVYYCSLFARKKYAPVRADVPWISSDKQQLRRFTSTKDVLFEKIAQLEIPLGRYFQKGNPMPQEALALYITPNPRSFTRAAKAGLIRLANLITKPYEGWNTHQEIMSEVQKAGGTTHYVDFDFDDVDDSVQDQIKYFLGDAVTILETRGGFHALVNVNQVPEEHQKSWYVQMTKMPGCDVRGSDNMIPVPGCTQGGFCPYFSL